MLSAFSSRRCSVGPHRMSLRWAVKLRDVPFNFRFFTSEFVSLTRPEVPMFTVGWVVCATRTSLPAGLLLRWLGWACALALTLPLLVPCLQYASIRAVQRWPGPLC